MPHIVVHNHWGTYSGATPGDVLRRVHENAVASGNTQDYRSWREWNATVWKASLNLDLPTGDAPDDEKRFLQGLIQAKALRVGPQAAAEAQASAPGMR